MSQARIRNFCIVAHIDHGKSTLADRLIEATGAVREARRCRSSSSTRWTSSASAGITIKLNAVRMSYTGADGETYELNLIDTPGHVDFTYEVSRSLAACEGAILVVDASQGVQAQTLTNLFLAMDAGLEIIPVLNKIDLPGAEPERRAQEIVDLIGVEPGRDPGGLGQGGHRRARAPRGDRGPGAAARGRRGRAAPRADLRLVLRPLPGRDPQHPRGGRRGARGHGDRLRRAPGRRVRGRRGRLPPARPASRRRARGRRGGLHRRQPARRARRARGRHDPRRRTTARPSCCPATATSSRWCSPASIPTDSDQYEGLRDALEKLRAQRRQPALRARVVHGARLRVPLRLPRPAAHGDRPGAAGARVQPRPHHHRPHGGVPRLPHRRRRCCCWRTRATCPTRPRSTASTSRTSRRASWRRPSTSAPS